MENNFEFETNMDSYNTMEIPTIEEQLETSNNLVKKYESKLKYALADAENIRKRSAKEKTDLMLYRDENLGKDLLDVIDNFERSLNSFVVHDEINKSNKEGVEIIYNQLINVLKNHDIVKLDIKEHDIFNDSYMNAIGVINAPGFDKSEVVNVSKSAWLIKDKIMRFADVLVNN